MISLAQTHLQEGNPLLLFCLKLVEPKRSLSLNHLASLLNFVSLPLAALQNPKNPGLRNGIGAMQLLLLSLLKHSTIILRKVMSSDRPIIPFFKLN